MTRLKVGIEEWLSVKIMDVAQHIAEERDEAVRWALLQFHDELVDGRIYMCVKNVDYLTKKQKFLVQTIQQMYEDHIGEIGSNPTIGVD